MIKKKNKINIPLILCAVFVAVISCFACFNLNKPKESVFADTVYTDYSFVSSDTYHFDVYYRGGSLVAVYPCLFSTNFNYVGGKLSFLPNFYYLSSEGSNIYYNSLQHFRKNSVGDYYFYDDGYIPIDYGSTRFIAGGIQSDVMSGTGFLFDVYVDDGFNANVYKVDLFLSDTNSIITTASDDFKLLNLKYTDVNDYSLTLSFYTPRSFVFSSRTYYLISSDNLTDNQLYNQGYQDGMRDNQQNIYNQGYSAGESVGYGAGYNAGLEDTNQYTFFNLISATIDAPLSYFTSLFNFNLLGFNLKDFLLAIFTLCVVITIVNMCRR